MLYYGKPSELMHPGCIRVRGQRILGMKTDPFSTALVSSLCHVDLKPSVYLHYRGSPLRSKLKDLKILGLRWVGEWKYHHTDATMDKPHTGLCSP